MTTQGSATALRLTLDLIALKSLHAQMMPTVALPKLMMSVIQPAANASVQEDVQPAGFARTNEYARMTRFVIGASATENGSAASAHGVTLDGFVTSGLCPLSGSHFGKEFIKRRPMVSSYVELMALTTRHAWAPKESPCGSHYEQV